jgi:hypothetical protein
MRLTQREACTTSPWRVEAIARSPRVLVTFALLSCGGVPPVRRVEASATPSGSGPPAGERHGGAPWREAAPPPPIIVTLGEDDRRRFEGEREAARARLATAQRIAATAKWAPGLMVPCVQESHTALPACFDVKRVPRRDAQDCVTFCTEAAHLAASVHAQSVLERTVHECVEAVWRSGGAEPPVCHFPKPYDQMTEFAQRQCDERCARKAGLAPKSPND